MIESILLFFIVIAVVSWAVNYFFKVIWQPFTVPDNDCSPAQCEGCCSGSTCSDFMD